MSGPQATFSLLLQPNESLLAKALVFHDCCSSGVVRNSVREVFLFRQHMRQCGTGGQAHDSLHTGAHPTTSGERITQSTYLKRRKSPAICKCFVLKEGPLKCGGLSISHKISWVRGWHAERLAWGNRRGNVNAGIGGRFIPGEGKMQRHSGAIAAEEVDLSSGRRPPPPMEAMTRADTGFVRQLQRFLASAGLPLDTVPSPAELTKAGRQDLANGVHRRGRDVVFKLLSNAQQSRQPRPAQTPEASATSADTSSTASQQLPGPRTQTLNAFRNGESTHRSASPPNSRSAAQQDAYTLSSSGMSSETQTSSARSDSRQQQSTADSMGQRGLNPVPEAVQSSGGGRDPRRGGKRGGGAKKKSQPPVPQQLSLQERAALFLRTGSLSFEDEGGESSGQSESDSAGSENEDNVSGRVGESVLEEQNARTVPSTQPESENSAGSNSEDPLSAKKAALLKARLQRRMQETPDVAPAPPTPTSQREDEKEGSIVVRYSADGPLDGEVDDVEDIGDEEYAQLQLQNNENLFRDILENQREIEEMSQREHEMDEFKTETQKELERIKTALHARELELASMSRELEEAKAQLALMRAKATAELAQAQQAVVEKDVLLRAAEAALANLKHVRVEWWGEGSRVELAGSFNGWQYFVPMEPDLSSEIPQPDGTRGPMMWGIGMRLYPGIYEVKFIVDGRWEVDIRREVVTRNSSNQNNILRVE